jgi:ABC-type sugar transport system permease subunit
VGQAGALGATKGMQPTTGPRPRIQLFPVCLMLPAVGLVLLVTFFPIIQSVSLPFRETTYLKAGGYIGFRH